MFRMSNNQVRQNNKTVGRAYMSRASAVLLLCVAAGSLPAAGQVVTQLAVASPCGIAVDGTYIYWTEGCTSEDFPPNGQIFRLEIEGAMAGAAEPELIYNGLDHPAKLTFHDGYVYWTERGSGPIWLRRGPAGGGLITNVFTPLYTVAVNDSPPVSNGHFVYWNDDHDIWKMEHDTLPVPSKPLVNLTEHPVDPAYDIYGFAVDGTYIYYTRWNAGLVEKRKIKSFMGVTPSPQFLYGTFAYDKHPGPIAIDDSYVYWAEHHGATGGEIKRILKTGVLFGVETIYSGVPNVKRIAVSASDVYWIGDGWLCKRAKDGTGPMDQIAEASGEIKILDGTVFWGDPYRGVFVYK